ncbi:hypothetical protein [Insulibacter thermoxylanivorax]|nr:hypothetical protein [Insulibacter thermoxylanivorax]
MHDMIITVNIMRGDSPHNHNRQHLAELCKRKSIKRYDGEDNNMTT